MSQNIRVDLVELGFKTVLCELLLIFNTSGMYLYVLSRDCLEKTFSASAQSFVPLGGLRTLLSHIATICS